MPKAQMDLVAIISLVLIASIFIGGLYISSLFIDFEKQLENVGEDSDLMNTTGSLDIDEDVFDDMQEDVEEIQKSITKGWDVQVLQEWAVLILSIIFIVMILAFAFIQASNRF